MTKTISNKPKKRNILAWCVQTEPIVLQDGDMLDSTLINVKGKTYFTHCRIKRKGAKRWSKIKGNN